MKVNDTDRINWLNKHEGVALVSDDQGYWAVVEDGYQTLSVNPPADCQTTFIIKKKQWKSTVRKAIDDAIKRYKVKD